MPSWLHCCNSVDAYLIKTFENYDIIRCLMRSTLLGKQYKQNCMTSPPFWEQILLNWVGKSLFRFSHKYIIGFPRWCSSKESTCQCKVRQPHVCTSKWKRKAPGGETLCVLWGQEVLSRSVQQALHSKELIIWYLYVQTTVLFSLLLRASVSSYIIWE